MTKDTRSGLWESMFHAITAIRPRLVVWENVQGALSASAFSLMEPDQGHLGGRPTGPVLRALGRVLGDLSGIGYDATWTVVHASDVGAPHKRARVFVVAHPHGEPWLERWEPTTRETPGGRSWSDVSGRDRTPRTRTLIPTPTASDWKGGYHQEGKGMSLSQATKLLPTPVAQAPGNTAEAHLRKKPGRTQVTDLGIIAREGLFTTGGNLLPTPQATNATYSSNSRNTTRQFWPLRASHRPLGNHHRTHSPSPNRTTPTRGRQTTTVRPLRRMAHGTPQRIRHGRRTLPREDTTRPR